MVSELSTYDIDDCLVETREAIYAPNPMTTAIKINFCGVTVCIIRLLPIWLDRIPNTVIIGDRE
jgi:hypothetical protein